MLGCFDEFLEFIFNSQPDKLAIGIDIKYNHFIYIPNIIGLLRKHEVQVLHLVRKNLLKTLISCVLNEQKAVLKRKSHGTQKVQPARVHLKPDKNLINELRRRRKQIDDYRKLLSTHLRCLEIYYEDFFTNSASESDTIAPLVLEKVYDFLDIQDKQYKLETSLRKTNPDDLRLLIENFEEVSAVLTDTEFGHFLNQEDSA